MEKSEIVSTEDGQEVDVIQLGQRQKVDYSLLTSELLGMTLEECKQKGGVLSTGAGVSDNGDCTLERLEYEDKTNELTVVQALDDLYCTAFTGKYLYEYEGENVGQAYYDTIPDYGMVDAVHLNRLRADYPQEEISTCTKEEAVEKCKNAAKAAGYENSTVNVYAMTVDTLNRNYLACDGASMGRPTKYNVVDNPEEFFEDQEEWTEEYEAMYLVYQPIANNVEIDAEANTYDLQIIYSPKYKRIVYASWKIPFADGTVAKKEKLISEDTAKQTVITSMGVQDEKNIVFDDIQRVNTITNADTMSSEEHLLVPVWRVDYHLLNYAEYSGNDAYKTALVNAVTGKICRLTEEG
jgi:hypothetical protein